MNVTKSTRRWLLIRATLAITARKVCELLCQTFLVFNLPVSSYSQKEQRETSLRSATSTRPNIASSWILLPEMKVQLPVYQKVRKTTILPNNHLHTSIVVIIIDEKGQCDIPTSLVLPTVWGSDESFVEEDCPVSSCLYHHHSRAVE